MARKKQTSKKPTKAKSKAQAQQAKSTNQPINENINPQQDDTLYKLLDAKIEIPIQVLREKHIFIATPCYGGQIGEPYFRSMMRLAILCNKYNIQYTISTLANNTDLLFVDERILLNNDKERKYLDNIFEYINDEEGPDLLLGHTR